RTDWRDAIAGNGTIASQHEDIVAQHLEVVLSEVARIASLVMPVWHLAISLHRQVTTKTARHPRRVARNTSHIRIAVRQSLIVCRHIAPTRVVFANRLRVTRLLAVVASAGRNRVDSLNHPPPAAWDDHRVLNDVTGFQLDVFAALILLLAIARNPLKERNPGASLISHTNSTSQVLSHKRLVLRLAPFGCLARCRRRCWSGGKQVRAIPNRAMTILATDLDGSAWFVIEIAVAV